MDFATNDGAATSGEIVRPSFGGTAGAMFPVVLKGLFLTLVTLGIYRFWYMTNVRRFLWNNTEVGGDYLEYTGRGVELFIGFLIALAVLVPLYGLLFVATFQLGADGQAVVQLLFALIIVILAQFALYRARRYRMTRTIWRGIRFQQSGSGFAYAFRSLLWALATGITLGLAYPFMRASLERYKMNNTWYGDQQGAFSATGGQLFKRGLLLWLVVVGLIVAISFAIGSQIEPGGGGKPSPDNPITIGGPLLIVLILAIAIPVYWAIEYRWWANGCSIGSASARCDVGLFGFFKIYIAYMGIALLLGLVISLVAGAVGYAVFSSGVLGGVDASLRPPVGFIVAVAFAYILVGLIFAALWQVFLLRPIWRKSFESVEISGLGALMAAQSAEPEANAFGEGVADAIDFGGF